jgi:hypothetical protein
MTCKANTPFDKLLQQYGISRTTLVKKIAKDDLKGYEEKPSYLAQLEQRKKIRKKDISRYARQLREPGMTMFYYLSQKIGCSPEELLPTLKQNRAIHINLSKLAMLEEQNDDELKEVLEGIKSKSSFFIDTKQVFIFFLNDGGTIWRNFYQIQCLQDGLEAIKPLDSYLCAEKQVEFISPKSRFLLEKEEAGEYTYLNVLFKKPLKEGERVSIVTDIYLDSSSEKISNFCIRHPTELLTINLVPKEAEQNKSVKLYKFRDQSAYLKKCPANKPVSFSHNRGAEIKIEIDKPDQGIFYKLEWG